MSWPGIDAWSDYGTLQGQCINASRVINTVMCSAFVSSRITDLPISTASFYFSFLLICSFGYTVQCETHFADEKEPDITLTSRHGGGDLPVEIKVVDGLSVKQLETALEVQLCGQYLRHGTARHGMLLVHQHPCPGGWEIAPSDPFVPFSVVMDYLYACARAIRESAATGPQPVRNHKRGLRAALRGVPSPG